MPRRGIDQWMPYLDDVLALWTELGPDFKVGGMTQAQVTTLRANLQTILTQINSLQAELGLAMGARDAQIAAVEELAVKFRAAVIAQYGPKSIQAGRVPRATTPRSKRVSASKPDAPPKAGA